MKIEQIYTGCQTQGAYYIVSNGEAAIAVIGIMQINFITAIEHHF